MSDAGTPTPPPPPPPSAGGGGPIPSRGLGDILTTAFDLYKVNASKLIQLVAMVVIPLSLVQAIIVDLAINNASGEIKIDEVTGQVTIDSGGLLQSVLGLAIVALMSVVIQQLLAGSLTRGAAGSLLGRPVDVGESYRYAFSRIGGLIGLAIVVGLIVFVGYLLLIIPGIIFGVFFAMAMPAFIVERKGITASMSRSWQLVRGSWWHTLGVIVVAGILAGIVSGAIGAIGGSTLIGSWIFGAIGQIITAPFVALVAVVLYVDLRARHENLSAEQLGGELDTATA